MASFVFNVTFDCSDPRRQATFWSAVTGYRPVIERDDYVALRAPDSRGVRQILFFLVPEPKVAKSRIHVDLATRDDPEREIERLVGLGATKVEYREGNGTSWTVMLDPEGNEFCIG
ncbi:MAG TPA: VOC family protein [Acidimicrobiales bacterium]|nr:VOC family protein [Acidimicrobiales bacterium]